MRWRILGKLGNIIFRVYLKRILGGIYWGNWLIIMRRRMRRRKGFIRLRFKQLRYWEILSKIISNLSYPIWYKSSSLKIITSSGNPLSNNPPSQWLKPTSSTNLLIKEWNYAYSPLESPNVIYRMYNIYSLRPYF